MASLLPDIFQILIDSISHRQTVRIWCRQQAGFPGLKFDELCSGCGNDFLKKRTCQSAFLSAFVLVQVVAAFRMMLFFAVDPNVVPDNLAIAFDDWSKRPLAVDLDHLDDIDTVRSGSRHS